MTTTELTEPPPAHDEGPEEIVPLIGVVPQAGPPVLFVAAPLVLFALVLSGPFLLVLTLGALLAACAVLVAVAGALVASPYLLVRRLGGHGLARAHRSAPAVQLVPVDSPRGPA